MNTLFAQNMLLFAGEAFVMSAIVLALAWEASHLFRNRASLRHLVWVGAFVALLLLPLLAWIVPAQIHFTVPAAPVVASNTQALNAAPIATGGHATANASRPAFHIDLETIAFGLLSLYLAGVCAIALRGLAAVLGLHALKRGSRAHIFDDLPRGRYQVRLSKSPNGYGPITWGLFRPIILLPFNAHFWPRERLQAVLLHETAHIARHDSLSQLLSLLVCALYWPNPLVWFAAHALRNEAELAADDQVIASGMRPSSYAGELLQLASEFRSRQPALAGMPLFMAAPSSLEARVKSVLAPTPLRSGVTAMDVVKIGSVAVLSAAALTFARPSFAQDAAPSAVVESVAPVEPAPPVAPLPAQPALAPTPAAPAMPPIEPAAEIERVHPYIAVHRSERMVHGRKIRHVSIDVDTDGATPEQLARMRAEIASAQADAREAQADNLRAEAEIRQREAEVRVHEAQLRALQEAEPRIEAEVQAALAKARPDIDRALSDAHLKNIDLKISEQVHNAFKHARVRIEMQDHTKLILHDDAGQNGPDEDAPDAN